MHAHIILKECPEKTLELIYRDIMSEGLKIMPLVYCTASEKIKIATYGSRI